MYFLTYLSFVLIMVVNFSMARPEVNVEELRQKLFTECIAQEGASEQDVAELSVFQLPTTRTGQCLHTCIMEKLGLLKDGKFEIEVGEMLAEQTHGHKPEIVKVINEVSTGCANSVAFLSDRCDYSFEMMKCNESGLKSRGYSPKELLDP